MERRETFLDEQQLVFLSSPVLLRSPAALWLSLSHIAIHKIKIMLTLQYKTDSSVRTFQQ